MSNLEMLRKLKRQSNDRQGWIGVARRREYRGTRDEQVLYSEHPAVLVYHAVARRVSHACRAEVVSSQGHGLGDVLA